MCLVIGNDPMYVCVELKDFMYESLVVIRWCLSMDIVMGQYLHIAQRSTIGLHWKNIKLSKKAYCKRHKLTLNMPTVK